MKQIPGGVTAPKGFTASGVHCGVKKGKGDGNQPPMSKMPEVLEGKKDLALIVSEQPCVAAAVYTMHRVKAAPLYVIHPNMGTMLCLSPPTAPSPTRCSPTPSTRSSPAPSTG